MEQDAVFSSTGGFVAGTLVHTKNGPVPIEKISVGDWVLSKNGRGSGGACFRRVLDTIEYEEKAVFSVDFVDDSGMETIVASGGHPFWVFGKGWVRADFLQVNDILEGVDGSTCSVFNVSSILKAAEAGVGWIQGGFGIDDPDDVLGRVIDFRNNSILVDYNVDHQVENDVVEPALENLLLRKVYTFEVEDFHTYYVGKFGVWIRQQ
jgi:hypothetical protein